jgi:hypothetical protein
MMSLRDSLMRSSHSSIPVSFVRPSARACISQPKDAISEKRCGPKGNPPRLPELRHTPNIADDHRRRGAPGAGRANDARSSHCFQKAQRIENGCARYAVPNMGAAHEPITPRASTAFAAINRVSAMKCFYVIGRSNTTDGGNPREVPFASVDRYRCHSHLLSVIHTTGVSSHRKPRESSIISAMENRL